MSARSRTRSARRGGRVNPGAFDSRRTTSDLSRSSREGTMPVAPRIAVASIIGAVVFGVLVLRLWALTVLGGAEYAALADQNQIRNLRVEAPRGSILDRKGKVLVANRASQQVVLNLQDVPEERVDGLVSELARVLDVETSEIQERIDNAPPGALEPIVLRGDLKGERDTRAVQYLKEHRTEFPGVDVRTVYVRSYEQGTAAAHILGQVGLVSEEQLTSSHTNRKSGDRIGVSGIERTYDESLRGVDGYRAVKVDAAGVRQGEGRGLPPTIGRSLKLTLDLDLQKATDKALARGVRNASATADGRGAFSAAAIMVDVNNGEILSSSSAPTYDPDVFTTPGHDREIKALYNPNNKQLPMFNRVLQGAYTPGSIFKPISALAAMDIGVLTPEKRIACPPYLPLGEAKFRNHTNEHLGSITLKQSLETSCNTFYGNLALYFYNDPGSPLQDWSEKFGLGSRTGVDVPGEIDGLVPSVEWRKKTFTGAEKYWRPGDSLNMSIGQGDLQVTPLQMVSAYVALANGGTLHTPHFGLRVEDPSGRVARDLVMDKPRELNLDPGDLAGVTEGLVAVNSGGNGTASAVFGSFKVPTAGKTGTVERNGERDSAWYCGYAPVEKPEVAACSFIENGGHGGSDAAPIVLEMFRAYFNDNSGNTEVEGVTPD